MDRKSGIWEQYLDFKSFFFYSIEPLKGLSSSGQRFIHMKLLECMVGFSMLPLKQQEHTHLLLRAELSVILFLKTPRR